MDKERNKRYALKCNGHCFRCREQKKNYVVTVAIIRNRVVLISRTTCVGSKDANMLFHSTATYCYKANNTIKILVLFAFFFHCD